MRTAGAVRIAHLPAPVERAVFPAIARPRSFEPTHSMSQSPLTLEEIETEVQQFEAAERNRLGLQPSPAPQWHDRNPQQFERAQRRETTILAGGLTIAQDTLLQAALERIGYRIEVLPCPDTAALHYGKEF